MKLQKILTLAFLVSLGCLLLPTSALAIKPVAVPDYYWTGSDGNGTFDDANNFANYLGSTTTWTNGGKPTGNTSAGPVIIFGFTGGNGVQYTPVAWNVSGVTNPFPLSPAPQTVTFDSNTVNSVGTLSVQSGTWTFNLAGGVLSSTVNTTGSTLANLSFGGNNSATTPTASFTPTVQFENGTVNVGNLTLGANGSSNNIWGGTSATITFASNASAVFSASSRGGNATVLTIGDGTSGSTGNVFNGTAGQTLGNVIVNAGAGNEVNLVNETAGTLSVLGTGASANVNGSTIGAVTISGGSASLTGGTAGDITVNGGLVDLTGGAGAGAVTINAGAATSNGSTLTGPFTDNSSTAMVETGLTITSTTTAIALSSGANLSITGGSQITSTGSGLSAGTNGPSATGVTVGTGSILTIDNSTVTTQNVTLTGDTTIQNGGSLSTNGGITFSGGSVEGLPDMLSGTLNITGGSSFQGDIQHSTKNFDGQDGFMMGANALISVTNGSSFLEDFGVSENGGTANFNVDSSSSITIVGALGVNSGSSTLEVNITGNGTVSAGSFSETAVANVGDVFINTGTGILSVGTLMLNNGPSIGTRGNVQVTGALVLGKTSTMASGDVLEFNGNNVTVSASSAGKGLAVNAGAVVSGQGHVSQAASNGGIIGINGGTLRVGDASAINGQTLAFNTGSLEVSGGSTLEFSLYADDGSSDQLRIDPTSNVFFIGSGASLTLKLNLVGDLATLKTLFDAGDTTFDLVGDLDGDALTGAGGSGGLNNLTFTVDSATVALFASEGYSIDTSAFGTTGSISLVAESVPEPSTWVMMGAGLAALVFFQRRRRAFLPGAKVVG